MAEDREPVEEHPDNYSEFIGGQKMLVDKLPAKDGKPERWRVIIAEVIVVAEDLAEAQLEAYRQTIERLDAELHPAREKNREALERTVDAHELRVAVDAAVQKKPPEITGYICPRGCRYGAKMYFKCPEHGTTPVYRVERQEIVTPIMAGLPEGLPEGWETPVMKFYRQYVSPALPKSHNDGETVRQKWDKLTIGVGSPTRAAMIAVALELEAQLFNELSNRGLFATVGFARFMLDEREWYLEPLRGRLDDAEVIRLESMTHEDITEENADTVVGFWLKLSFPAIRARLGPLDDE